MPLSIISTLPPYFFSLLSWSTSHSALKHISFFSPPFSSLSQLGKNPTQRQNTTLLHSPSSPGLSDDLDVWDPSHVALPQLGHNREHYRWFIFYRASTRMGDTLWITFFLNDFQSIFLNLFFQDTLEHLEHLWRFMDLNLDLDVDLDIMYIAQGKVARTTKRTSLEMRTF